MGLSAYTLLTFGNGEKKRAEDTCSGDELQEALSGELLLVTTVLNSPGVGMVRIQAEGDIILDLTGDHNLLTDSGPIAAGRITPGMLLTTPDGFARCTEAGPLMGDYMVYDIVVECEAGLAPHAIANGLIAVVPE